MKKVTGIGGIFFKCKDPKALKEWYKTHLGIEANTYGASFEYPAHADKKTVLQWSPFSEATTYFEPSNKDFMINYIVEDIESLFVELKAAGVNVLGEIASYDYGKFLHLLDLEGNKVELWQPAEEA
jgi:predicted enzyme related to lactoylglutathione lyase